MFSADEVAHGNGKPYISVPEPTFVEDLQAKTARVTATARVKPAFRNSIRLCPNSYAYIVNDGGETAVRMKLSRDHRSAKIMFTRHLDEDVSVVAVGRRVR